MNKKNKEKQFRNVLPFKDLYVFLVDIENRKAFSLQ